MDRIRFVVWDRARLQFFLVYVLNVISDLRLVHPEWTFVGFLLNIYWRFGILPYWSDGTVYVFRFETRPQWTNEVTYIIKSSFLIQETSVRPEWTDGGHVLNPMRGPFPI